MFNFLVKYSGWAEGRDRLPAERVLEFTDERLTKRLRPEGHVDFDRLVRLPAVFAQEITERPAVQPVRIGTIIRATSVGRDIALEYTWDRELPALINEDLENLANELDIATGEFTRTHWSVKSTDIFRALLRVAQPRQHRPRVFQLAEPERIEPSLVSVMMPFSPAFDAVYATLRETAEQAGLRCRRADDIWENPAVIQDVVALIDRSRVVVADCTGRNANVFYEIGIAHTIGREVILITQHDGDIPFDLRHLRYVRYLDNGEGRTALSDAVRTRLHAVVGG